MVYVVEISISDLGKNYDYKSKVWYNRIELIHPVIDFMETMLDNIKYGVPKPIYNYIVNEDINIGLHPFSITILMYNVGIKGVLFVQVKKRLLHNLVEVV